MAIVPQHKVDHTPMYLLTDDDAWKSAKVKKTLQALSEWEERVIQRLKDEDEGTLTQERIDEVKAEMGGEPVDDYVRYVRGTTRYDLDAGKIRDWIDEKQDPMYFELRRLKLADINRIKTLIKRDDETLACELAFKMGVVDMHNQDYLDFNDEKARDSRGRLTDAFLEAFKDKLSISFIEEVGRAVIHVNRDLSQDELKASG